MRNVPAEEPEKKPEDSQPENQSLMGDEEMSEEFWQKLSQQTGIIFPLVPPSKKGGRIGQLFPKKPKPEPEERITRARKGNSTVRDYRKPKKSSVRLRGEKEEQPAPDPFTRKPRGGVSKLRVEQPKDKNLTARPGRKSNIVLKDRDGKGLKNPNLRYDPVPQEFGRKWKDDERWTPDWIRHHTYTDEDRIRFGRLLEFERNPDLEQPVGQGQIRYGLSDNPHFTTDSGHYWKLQEKEPFMDVAESLAKRYAPEAKTWGDIEGGPFFLKRFEGTRSLCYSYKIRKWWRPILEGIRLVHTDRMLNGIRGEEFDVSFVLHLTKSYPVDLDCLFAVSRLAVVVVYPYEWKEGTPDQIGMNEEWLRIATRKQFTRHEVVEGTTRRGVAIYRK